MLLDFFLVNSNFAKNHFTHANDEFAEREIK